MSPNLYAILGVERTATAQDSICAVFCPFESTASPFWMICQEIESAYRRLSLILHPDKPVT